MNQKGSMTWPRECVTYISPTIKRIGERERKRKKKKTTTSPGQTRHTVKPIVTIARVRVMRAILKILLQLSQPPEVRPSMLITYIYMLIP